MMSSNSPDGSSASAPVDAPDDGWRTRVLDTLRSFGRGRLGVLGFQARVMACLALLMAAGSVVSTITTWSQASIATGLQPVVHAAAWTFIVIGVGAGFAVSVISIRRNHDLGRSGWWTLLNLVPIVNVFWMLYVWFHPGADRPNRFGAAPRPGALERALGRAGLVMVSMLMLKSCLELQISAGRHESDAARGAALAGTIDDEGTRRDRRIDRLEDFERLYVDAPLTLLLPNAEASMRFATDGTLTGTIVQHDGERHVADLVWRWQGGMLCHEGQIARVTIALRCGNAARIDGVGFRVTYPGSSASELYRLTD